MPADPMIEIRDALRELRDGQERLGSRLDTIETELGSRLDTIGSELGSRIDGIETELGSRIDGIETKLGSRIDGIETKLGSRIDRIESKLDTLSSDFKEARRYTNDTLDAIVEKLTPAQGPKAASAR